MASTKNKEGFWLGIDLGTTTSCCAAPLNSKIEVIKSMQDKNTLPSVVLYNYKSATKTNEVIVGQRAENKMGTEDTKRIIYMPKRFIGRENNASNRDLLKQDIQTVAFDVTKDDSPNFQFILEEP